MRVVLHTGWCGSLAVGGGDLYPREVVGIPPPWSRPAFTTPVMRPHSSSRYFVSLPFLSTMPVMRPLGVVLQLLAGPLPMLTIRRWALARSCPVLHTAAHAVQPLEQPAIGIVGIALEHVAVRAEYREHRPWAS